MDRRRLVRLGMAALAVAAIDRQPAALAANAQATRIASRSFLANQCSLDASVAWFADGAAGFRALTAHATSVVDEPPGSQATFEDIRNVTKFAPPVGDERFAAAFSVSNGAFTTDVYALFARRGPLVYTFVAATGGYPLAATPAVVVRADTLANTANGTAKAVFARTGKTQSTYTDQELLGLLPTLDEVPGGKRQIDQTVTDDTSRPRSRAKPTTTVTDTTQRW